jgi:hypothetical protein
LNGKQATITSSTDLECNTMTTKSLEVDTSVLFNTTVLRRPTGITGEAGDYFLAFRELQCWVNGSNLLQSTLTTKTAMFSNFLINEEVDLGALGSTSSAINIYDNSFGTEFDTHSIEGNSNANIFLIIRNIPLTSIESIQSLVLYNRTGQFTNTTIVVAIELYNSTDDPNLNTILATTAVITTAVNVYRFDFPSIDTYTGSFASADSTTQIASDIYATTHVVSVSASPSIQITGDVVVSDSITASSAIIKKYFYEADDVVKAFGLYGSTLHYYQVEDNRNTFIISDVNEGDTIFFPAGSLDGDILMDIVRSVSFVGIPNGTFFSGTMDIATTLNGGNRSCRFENIIFERLVVIQGPRMGHIFRNCEFSVGLTLNGPATSADSDDIQFIDCIIRGLTLTKTYFSLAGRAYFRRCNFKYQSINAIQSIPSQMLLEDCINILDDLETISSNYLVHGSAQYVNDLQYLNIAKNVIYQQIM